MPVSSNATANTNKAIATNLKKTKKGTSRSAMEKWWTGYPFVAPAFITILLVTLFPLLYGTIMSFYDVKLANVMKLRQVGLNPFAFFTVYAKEFKGLGSYINVLIDPGFIKTLLRTIAFTVINVFFHVSIGIWLAIMLNRKLPGKEVFRILLILPWAVPQYIAAVTWKGMFNSQFGVINIVLLNLGVPAASLPKWLSDPTLFFIAICITNIWLGFSFMMMIALGGLTTIPSDLYEAADIDGANGIQKLFNVTLPLLQPIMTPSIVLGTVWTFNMLNVPFILKGGQLDDTVNLLATKMYRDGFDLYRYGYAAAMGVIIFILLLIFSLFYLKMNKSLEN